MAALLRLREVDTYYGEMHILQGVSLEVGEGELVCLLGGNASGKSTTLKTILGIVQPRRGIVELAGEDVTTRPTSYRIRRGMAIVPENRRVFAPMTVLENLELGARLGRDRGALALACVERLSFTYAGAERPAVEGISLTLEPGQIVALLGPSGAGKSTLLRALAGLVPHFHGGRFAGRVEIAGRDTRRTRPAELAGAVATLFQDPEDQVVLTRVENEVAFGLENLGIPPEEIPARVAAALAAVQSAQLTGRRVGELSAGELQRVCLASALALEPDLLLLDEPTSQLDSDAADALLELSCGLATERGATVVVSEQRPARPLSACDRVLFLEGGRLLLDARRDEALDWLAARRPAYLGQGAAHAAADGPARDVVCRVTEVGFSYDGTSPVLDGARLELRRGEIVALQGPNGAGKTTLAKIAAGLLEPQEGTVARVGRAAYLSQDPGRYVVKERADEEVALAVGGDLQRARRALAAVGLAGYDARHPRDLSSGERERLALAAVLVGEPDLLVLDEPTRGVDPDRKRELAGLLRRHAPERATLVVTHDRLFASTVADRLVSLAPEQQRAFA